MMPVSEWASKVPDQNVSGVMQGDALRSIEQSSGGIRFGNVIEISGEAVTRSEKDATALADVIRFLTGLVQLNQKDARITGPAKLLQSLDLRTEGNVMKLSLFVPLPPPNPAASPSTPRKARSRSNRKNSDCRGPH
jgi:hypothetical protein